MAARIEFGVTVEVVPPGITGLLPDMEEDRIFIISYWSVLRLCVGAKINESNQAFHAPTACQSATVAITGVHNGNMIRKKIVISFAPSIFADSASESGSELINVRITITLKALRNEGMM